MFDHLLRRECVPRWRNTLVPVIYQREAFTWATIKRDHRRVGEWLAYLIDRTIRGYACTWFLLVASDNSYTSLTTLSYLPFSMDIHADI